MYPERTTDHGQATGKLFHLLLRVECTLFVIYKAVREPTSGPSILTLYLFSPYTIVGERRISNVSAISRRVSFDQMIMSTLY